MALDAQQIFERVSPSIVVIKAGNSQGSGVVYGADQSGLTPTTGILTNCHVVKGHTQVIVERLGKQSKGEVLACDTERDMALIQLGGILPTLPRRTTPLKVGEPAFAVGAPQGLELSISQGIVSQLRPTALGKDPMIQTTAAISRGSSGGGLFDSEGRLMGQTTLYYKDGQSLNFAVPHSFFALLKSFSSGSSPNRPTTATPSPNAPSQQKCGWSRLGEASVDGGFKYYIDYCKIMGTGRYRFAWTLTDFTSPQRDPSGSFYVSDVNKRVYDCQLSRSAITAVYNYAGKMGHGLVVGSTSVSESEWEFSDSPPGSVGASQIEAVCK